MEPRVSSGKVNCQECGRVIDQESHFCQYCGHEPAGEEEKKDLEKSLAAEEKPLLPILGGIMIMISSVFLLATILLVRDLRDEADSIWPFGIMDDWPDWFLVILGAFVIVGIIGGVSAIMRKSQAIAIAGGVASSFGLGAIIGITGLVLIAASEDEFKSRLTDYTDFSETMREKEPSLMATEKPGFGRWR